MESSTLSPSSHLSHSHNAEGWKTLKRVSERYSETEENTLCCNEEFDMSNRHSKRFKDLGKSFLEDACFKSPINVGVMFRPKRISQNKARFQETTQGVLSPITEISMNLNETSLGGGNSLQDSPNIADYCCEESSTPVKRLRKIGFRRSQLCEEGE